MDPKTLINYYIRKGWTQHVQSLCEKVLDKRGHDATLVFWRAFAIGLEGSYAEAIRELDNLKSKRDVEYPCIAALIHMHKQCKLIDHEEVAQLEMIQLSAEDRASDASLLLCANLYWHLGKIKDARTILNKVSGSPVTPQTPTEVKAALLRGWVDMTAPPKSKDDVEMRSNSISYFESIKKHDDPEIVIGMAKFYELKKAFSKALKYLDECIVKYQWFEPALTEKVQILLKTGEWELCIDTAERALRVNQFDIEALRLLILYYLTREGNATEGCRLIGNLFDALNRTESSNASLFYEVAVTQARISDSCIKVLESNIKFVDRAIQLRPDNGKYISERGYQLRLMGKYREAIQAYKEALRVDESNESALYGLIYCQIKHGSLDDAKQQMEFLSVIQETSESKADLMFLEALLGLKQQKDTGKQIQLLQQAVETHMLQLKKFSQSGSCNTYELMVQMNPCFLSEIAQVFVEHGGVLGSDRGASVIQRGIAILEKLISKSPGAINVQMALANAKYFTNDLETASKAANTVLSMDKSNPEAYLLLARIALDRDRHGAASSSLEEALSHDFTIRQRPIYHIIKARILKGSGDLNEVQKVLEGAMKQYSGKKKSTAVHVSLHDRASLYTQLAEVYSELHNATKAQDIIKEAMRIFRGTTEEVRILVANSELAIKRNDFDSAIKILNSVPPESSAYTNAQMVKANVYLQHRRDEKLYAKCFEDLVALNPTAETYLRLGEAFLKIHRYNDAVTAMQTALELDPSDFALASKIGRTLISMHDYSRAVDYYEAAVRQAPERVELRHDLAHLYCKMEKYDTAIRLLHSTPERNSDDSNDLIEDVKILRLRARVEAQMQNNDLALLTLKNAKSVQGNVLRKIRGEQPSFIDQQKAIKAEICFELSKLDEEDKVKEYYLNALDADKTHEPSLLALAQWHFKNDELEKCQEQCSTILRLNPSNEEASIMLADIMFKRADYESAVYHFKELLRDKPDNFVALSRYVMMLRRAGKLKDAPEFFSAAEKMGPRTKYSAGLHYCRGLYSWYSNNISEAIEEFNAARRDGEWGNQALVNMIQIYLNPDNENLWDEAEVGPEQTENIRTATKLFHELGDERTDRNRVVQAYILISSKSPNNLETAATKFLEILETNQNYIPALLGLAIAYMLLNRQSKARNHLKRIASMAYDQHAAEEFETTYLLLADIYVGRAKYDLAQELCKKALTHNKSSGKAWETLGLVMEKEQSYQDAAESYEKAWECEGEASATIGFKLAFNYLKAKRYVEAIDVCNKVLKEFPNYPKIRTKILDKAYEGLRP